MCEIRTRTRVTALGVEKLGTLKFIGLSGTI